MNATSKIFCLLSIVLAMSCGPSVEDDDSSMMPIGCPLGAQVLPAKVTVSDTQGMLVDCATIEWSFVPQETAGRSSLNCGSCAGEEMSEPRVCEDLVLNGLQGIEILELQVTAEGYRDYEMNFDIELASDGCSVITQDIQVVLEM